MIVMLLGQSRVFFSMSKDGLLPKMFSAVHPKFRTPWISSLTVGLVVATFASLIPLASLGEMTSIGTLLAFIIVCAGVWVLRKRSPELPRPFRAPWMPLTPILGIVVSLVMMLALPGITWYRLVIWLDVGLIIYLSYGLLNSRVQGRPLTAFSKKEVALRGIAIGALYCIGGGLIAGVTRDASHEGGVYYGVRSAIVWGAIVFGAWRFVRGAIHLASTRPA
jgi:amino acid transporter